MMHSGLRALQRRLEKNNPILYNENAMKEERFLSLLKGKLFWIEDKDKHKEEDSKYGDLCCWNHIVGLPKKDKEGEKAIFDYEMDILRLLEGGEQEEGENDERGRRRRTGV